MISALLLCAAVSIQAPVEIILKKDQNWSLFVTQNLAPAGAEPGEECHIFAYRVALKVVGANAKGFSLQSERTLLIEQFDGVDLPPPKENKPLVEKFSIGSDATFGFEFERYLDPAEFRLSRLAWIVAPKGGRLAWTLNWPTVGPNWAPAAEMAFLQPDKQPDPSEIKYNVRYGELGVGPRIEGEGWAVFDRPTMNLLRCEGSFRDVPMPGGEGLYSLKLSILREVKGR